MSAKVHRVKDKTVVRHFKTIPYDEIAGVLKEDGVAFLEDLDPPLKRQTVHKAAKKLTAMLGKVVKCQKRLLQLGNGDENISDVMEGYYFEVEEGKKN